MADFYLGTGDSIEVDSDIAELLTGQWWQRRGKSVQRRYWQAGRVCAETLTNVVMGKAAPRGKVWAHADGNSRNFRRENLIPKPRGYHLAEDGVISPEQRRRNSKKGAVVSAQRRAERSLQDPDPRKFEGVRMQGSKYRAVAPVKGMQKHLGLFDNKEAAARAYDAALVAQGINAVNFPDDM